MVKYRIRRLIKLADGELELEASDLETDIEDFTEEVVEFFRRCAKLQSLLS